MDEVQVAEAQASPSQATENGGPAAEAGTSGAAQDAVLSAGERQTLRATLAAAHPDAVAELITGATVREMIASVETAKAAYQRVIEHNRATIPVAAGGGGRPVGLDTGKLSPIAKISLGLKGQ